MTGYYDIVLASIPVALLGVTAALLVAGFSLTAAVPIASLLAIGLIGHAMFIRSPIDPTEGRQRPRPPANIE